LAVGGQARSRASVANATSCMSRAQPGCRAALANALFVPQHIWMCSWRNGDSTYRDCL
jgi:hypothetical protein